MENQINLLSQPATTEMVPLVPFRVIAADIPFFTDEKCENEVQDARIVIIQALDPEDQIQELDTLPSTQGYKPGQYVNLALEHKKIWDECWYRDPESGEITQAWKVHVNFTGEVISRAAIDKDRERINGLEHKVKEKIDLISKSKSKPVN